MRHTVAIERTPRIPQTLAASCRRGIHGSRLVQVALVLAFWLVGTAIVDLAGLPIPGGIVGMLIARALLSSQQINIASVRRGAEWILADILLFFVPAVLAVVDHREFLGLLGLKILIVILAGTAAVMGVTAFTVDLAIAGGRIVSQLIAFDGDAVAPALFRSFVTVAFYLAAKTIYRR